MSKDARRSKRATAPETAKPFSTSTSGGAGAIGPEAKAAAAPALKAVIAPCIIRLLLVGPHTWWRPYMITRFAPLIPAKAGTRIEESRRRIAQAPFLQPQPFRWDEGCRVGVLRPRHAAVKLSSDFRTYLARAAGYGRGRPRALLWSRPPSP